MNQIATASALLLAAMFLWAGQAKLRDRRATAASFAALGVRIPVLAVVASEVLTAAALLVRPRVGGAAAVLLLVAFTVVLLRALVARSTVTCGCFGSASTEPVGASTIVRNLFLLGASLSTLSAARPEYSFASLLTVSIAAMVGLVVVTLVALRSTLGPLLAGTSLAGASVPGPASVALAADGA